MIVGFQQQAGAPPGAGIFSTDDGRAFEAYSPDDAAPFLQAPAPPPDGNVLQKVPRGAPDPNVVQLDKVPPGAPPPPPPDQLQKVAYQSPMAPEMTGTGQRMVEPPAAVPPAMGQPRVVAPTPIAPSAPAPPPLVGGDPRFGMAPKGMRVQAISRNYEGAGAPYTEEEQQARAEASALETEAHRATAVSQMAQANAAQLEAQKRAVAAQQELVRAKNDRENEIRSFGQRKQEVDDEVDQAMRREVNPNKWFEDRGVIGTIGAALAQALGAYGATLGRTPNFTQQIIDQAVSRDVAAQRDAVERDGLRANNKLADLMRTHQMTINEATLRLQQSQQRLADSHAGELASASKSEDTRNAFNEWLAGRSRQRLDENRKFVNESLGKQSGKVEFTAKPVAGAGGLTHPILKQAFGSTKEAELAERQFYIAHPEASHGDFLSYVENVKQGKVDGAGGGRGGGEPAPLTRQKAKTETAKANMDMAANLMGAEPGQGWWSAQYTRASNALGEFFETPEGAKREFARATAAHEVAILMEMGQASDGTKEEVKHLLNSNNPRKWQAAKEIVGDIAKVEKEAINQAVRERKAGPGSALEDEMDSGRGR